MTSDPADSFSARAARTVGFGIVAAITLCCLAVAGGTLVHRIRLSPVRSAAPDFGIGRESLLALSPVPTAKLEVGDLVVIDRKDTHTCGLYKIDALVT